MYYTDDPIADFECWDAEQQRELDRLPECEYCGHPIQDEMCYRINDNLVCEDCLDYQFKVRTEDYADA